MTRDDLAALLDGREYPLRVDSDVRQRAEAAGLVIAYGSSDDVLEFEGAIHDEVGADDGTVVRLDPQGLIPEFDDLARNPDIDAMREFFRREEGGGSIKALWDPGDGYSWRYETDIPHAQFDIVEDGEPYCRALVFALADVPSSRAAAVVRAIATPSIGRSPAS